MSDKEVPVAGSSSTPNVALAPSLQRMYVDLGRSFSARSNWSNDPKDFDISTYFGLVKPNLASDFGVNQFLPVLRAKGGDDYLLQDDSGYFYLWNPWINELYQFDTGTTLAQAVAETTDGIMPQELTQVFSKRSGGSGSGAAAAAA